MSFRYAGNVIAEKPSAMAGMKILVADGLSSWFSLFQCLLTVLELNDSMSLLLSLCTIDRIQFSVRCAPTCGIAKSVLENVDIHFSVITT